MLPGEQHYSYGDTNPSARRSQDGRNLLAGGSSCKLGEGLLRDESHPLRSHYSRLSQKSAAQEGE